MGKTTIKSSIDLLWTNPNPTSLFASQTISLNLSNYSHVLVEFCMYASGDTKQVMASFYASITKYLIASCAMGNTLIHRECQINSANIIFDSGYVGANVNNSACIPYKIYGIK